MNKVKIHWIYPISVDIDTEKNVDVYIDCFEPSKMAKGDIRIIILQEPFMPNAQELYDFVRTNQDKYTYLLTYLDEFLTTIPKARLLMATSCWVRGYVPKEKKFSISTLVGGKVNPIFPGYKLRHDLWKMQDMILTPKDFYLSGEVRWAEADYNTNKHIEGSIVPLSKAPLFDSQFHIAIENISMRNMFTEKLIDCFQTRTVPIYYGCTNIGDFFNPLGMFQVNNLREMIDVCNSLTSDLYELMMPYIRENYIRSQRYCVYDDQIKKAIIKLI